MEFTIDTEYYDQSGVGEIALLQLCGPVDQKSVPIFEAEIQELFKNDVCRFVLDLSNTKYLNSSGLGLLINIAHKVNVVGGGIRLVNVAEKFKVLFDMLGLEGSLPIYENRDAALRSFGDGELTLKSEGDSEKVADEEPMEEISFSSSEALIDDPEEDKVEAVSLLTKKTLPNLKKNLNDKQDDNLKFTISEEEDEDEVEVDNDESSNLYDGDSNVDLEDDPDFELTGSLADITEKITEEGISSIMPAIEDEPEVSVSETMPDVAKSLLDKEKPVVDTPIEKTPVHIPKIQSAPAPSTSASTQEKEMSVSFIEESFSSEKTSKDNDLSEDNISFESTPEVTPPVQMKEPIKEPVKEELPRPATVITSRPQNSMNIAKSTVEMAKPILTKDVQWYTSVEYCNQMRKHNTFPLMLQIFKVDVVDEPKEQLKKLQNTNVLFIPRFPGCQVVPDKVLVDIAAENPRVEFWVTPSTAGEIPGWIEVMYEGKTSGFIKSPYKITNYYFAFVTFLLALLSTFSLAIGNINFLGEHQQWTTLSITAVLFIMSYGFFKKSFPKVDVVEKLLRIKMK